MTISLRNPSAAFKIRIHKARHYRIVCRNQLFTILSHSPKSIHSPKLPADMIPISETDFVRYAEIWKARRQGIGKKLPSASDWKLLENFVFSQIGNLNTQAFLEDSLALTLLFRNIEHQHGPDKAHRIYQLLFQIFKSMKADYLLPSNVCKGAYRPIHNPPVLFILSERQRDLIYRISNASSELAPIGFCLSTGITPEELCCLRLADYHMNFGSLSIRNSADSPRYPRELPLSQTSMNIIQNHRNRCAVLDPQSQLFCRPGMRRQTIHTMRTNMQAMKKLTRIPELSFSNIKRDFILNGIQNHLDPIQLKDYLGLKKPRLILEYFDLISQFPSERNSHE